jgi:hypothetical protein
VLYNFQHSLTLTFFSVASRILWKVQLFNVMMIALFSDCKSSMLFSGADTEIVLMNKAKMLLMAWGSTKANTVQPYEQSSC